MPVLMSAGASKIAKNIYAAVTVIPIPKTKLVIAPIINRMSGEPPAMESKSFTRVPAKPVIESAPTIRPIPARTPTSSAKSLVSESIKDKSSFIPHRVFGEKIWLIRINKGVA